MAYSRPFSIHFEEKKFVINSWIRTQILNCLKQTVPQPLPVIKMLKRNILCVWSKFHWNTHWSVALKADLIDCHSGMQLMVNQNLKLLLLNAKNMHNLVKLAWVLHFYQIIEDAQACFQSK